MRQRDITSQQVLIKEENQPSKSVGTIYSKRTADSIPAIGIIKHGREGRRVVVTGVGIISPIGIGKTAFIDALRSGKGGVRRITTFDPSSLPSQIAAEVLDFDPLKYMDRKHVLRTGRSSQFAVAASKMAVEDSGLDLSSVDPARVGVLMGAAVSGLEYASEQYDRYMKTDGRKLISPYTGIIVFGGACSSEVSITLNLKGPSHTISTGCASGNDAVGYAYRYIRSGEADIMFAGGAEAPIVPLVVASFSSMKAVSERNDKPERASRPFDKDRDGFVLGEGAGVLVLEERERARARGAHIYTEILGYGASNDAFHMSQPAPDGLEGIRAVRLALQEARLEPEDVEYVSAHGTSTPLNDKTETKIIRSVFGRHIYSDGFAVSSVKSMAGHAMGAASSIGLVASILARENSFLPPTINYEVPDPECDPYIDYVPNKAKHRQPQFILSNAFGFGGKNAILVIGDP